jgi:MEMO1 family protein
MKTILILVAVLLGFPVLGGQLTFPGENPSTGTSTRRPIMGQDIRKSIIAGSWYPGRPESLRAQIQGFLKAVPESAPPAGELVALISPHAGYLYSGGVAAHAYKLLANQPFKQVVIVAPSHRHAFRGASLDQKTGYETPLGVVPVDQALSRELMEQSKIFRYVPEGHAQEHALEIQLPFLQETLKGFSLTAIIQGSQDEETSEELARALAQVLKGKKVLLLASSDLSHFHTYDQAKNLDQKVLDRVAAFDEKGLMQDLKGDRVEACGGGAMVTVMKTARLLGATEAKVLHYANSGDVTGDRSGVVGYLAAAFFRRENPGKRNPVKEETEGYSPEERAFLHKSARGAIEHRLTGKPWPSLEGETRKLKEKRGAFVTLKRKGQLRGCIGYTQAIKPLSQTIMEMAQAAAFQDPRFPPLDKNELDDLEIEISVLTPFRPIQDVKEIEVGRHGLFIERGGYSGLLLPQVATEYHWDRQTFLEHTCLKAGLPRDAWKDKKTKIQVFSAEIF